MSVGTLLTFKESVAVFTKYPAGNGTVLCIAQFTRITAEIIFDFIITFLTRVVVFLASEE